MKILHTTLLTIFASCFVVSVAHAAPAISQTTPLDGFSGYPATADIHVSGSNPLGVIVVGDTSNTSIISSVTWDGSAMTEAVACRNTANNFTVRTYYIANPSTGTSTVSIGYTTAPSVGMFARAYAVSGVDLSDPINGCGINSGTGTVPSVSVTTTVDDTLTISQAITSSSCTAPTAVSPTVSSGARCSGSFSWEAGYRPPTTAGLTTHTYTNTSTWNSNVIALNPAPRINILRFFNRIMKISSGFVRVGV